MSARSRKAFCRWHQARRHHQQQAAAHQTLTHLRTAYHHATRTLTTPTPTTDPRITAHWATVLHTTHPTAAPYITTDPNWPALAALLHHHLHDHTFQHRHTQGALVPGAPRPTPRTRRSH
ncbi:hypothetical protein [Streptomyces profundus]|uniref:hypothetical protein n=1 Tax=Streptomyces profundus TaxID=2867410 RepID=UPI001D168A4E|nr:hypothetical protein [Streptomyces sp. MA3_2.13]UED85404.1 hypothetical protein K4G22_15350 [Streptomyces sp. MA3_2.13]